MKGLKDLILEEINSPSEQLVRMFAKQVYGGLVTAKIIEQFTDLTQRSFKQVISDMITDRFKKAINKEKDEEKSTESTASTESEASDIPLIETTEMEKEAFFIVKAILRKHIDIERVYERDTQSYFGILLDDNNRKPICRLYLNSSRKYLATFDENKKEVKHLLESLDDIYKYENEIIPILKKYERE